VVSNESIRKVVAEYFAALRAMDPEAWANTFAEDGVTHDPVGTPPHQGRAAVRQFLQGILSLFQEAGLTEDDVFVAGNGAAVKWTGRGRSEKWAADPVRGDRCLRGERGGEDPDGEGVLGCGRPDGANRAVANAGKVSSQ